jgi:hypothetical protein
LTGRTAVTFWATSIRRCACRGGFDLERFAALRRWLERVAVEPGHIPIDA